MCEYFFSHSYIGYVFDLLRPDTAICLVSPLYTYRIEHAIRLPTSRVRMESTQALQRVISVRTINFLQNIESQNNRQLFYIFVCEFLGSIDIDVVVAQVASRKWERQERLWILQHPLKKHPNAPLVVMSNLCPCDRMDFAGQFCSYVPMFANRIFRVMVEASRGHLSGWGWREGIDDVWCLNTKHKLALWDVVSPREPVIFNEMVEDYSFVQTWVCLYNAYNKGCKLLAQWSSTCTTT